MAYEQNRWRVIEVDGEQKFYVFRNPPDADFAKDKDGNRKSFVSRELAQSLVNELNAQTSH